MERERIDLKLYGVITEILPNGQISVCEPIFTDYWRKDKKLYRLITEDVEIFSSYTRICTFPKKLEEVDISEYGTPLFLPASRKKIGDGKKYFVIYQPSKNATIGTEYHSSTTLFGLTQETFIQRDFIPIHLTIGIKFPSSFIAVKKSSKLSTDELRDYIN